MIHEVLNEMMGYFGTDVRRINHALMVYGFASAIARSENLSDQTLDIIEIAAVLHDIGIPESERKYGSCIGKYQEIEGPPIAGAILEKLGVAPETIERVCFLIGHHHSYNKIDGVDFQILVEADFLVNIFEDGLLESVESIRDRYFKTPSGTRLLLQMYPKAG